MCGEGRVGALHPQFAVNYEPLQKRPVKKTSSATERVTQQGGSQGWGAACGAGRSARGPHATRLPKCGEKHPPSSKRLWSPLLGPKNIQQVLNDVISFNVVLLLR